MKLKLLKLFTFLFFLIYPILVFGFSFLAPFGGTVKNYDPAPEGCVSGITIPIAISSGFSTFITVEKIEVDQPKPATLGFLRINLAPAMPLLSNWKSNYVYMVPGTYVLGNSFDLCDVCGKITDFSPQFVKNFCSSIKGLNKILTYVCKLIGNVTGCPINNLIYQIGSGAPVGGDGLIKGGFFYISDIIKKNICKKVLDFSIVLKPFSDSICGVKD